MAAGLSSGGGKNLPVQVTSNLTLTNNERHGIFISDDRTQCVKRSFCFVGILEDEESAKKFV